MPKEKRKIRYEPPQRGDIYMADLTNHRLDSICGIRPVIIVQNDKGNTYSSSVIAAMITSKPKKPLPTHLVLGMKYGLRKNSTVLCEHLATIDKSMLIDYIGTVANTEDERKLNEALKISLSIYN